MVNELRKSLPEQSKFLRVAAPSTGKPEATAEALATAAAPAAASGLAAVIVVHGMGQQLPFETLDAVVAGLCRADACANGRSSASCDESMKATVRYAHVGATNLPRAELTLSGGDARAGGEARVHLFEAYWAPLTEGLVTLRDVMRFLWRAAANGRRNARGTDGFHRFMFGRLVTFGKQPRAGLQLLVAAAVLGALVLLNAVTAGILSAAVFGEPVSLWLRHALTAEVTLIVATALLVAGLCLLLMNVAQRMEFFYALLADVVLAALAIVAALAACVVWDKSWPLPGWLEWMGSPWWTGAFWAALFAVSVAVRSLFVQYVGDVAAYVTPHSLDRFYEVRQKIKQAVREVADAVYSDKQAGGAPTYARIAVVGHSLGSVVAYDVLNAMINLDAVATGARLEVVDRTCLLLTFGSPLDKTAFIFTAQGHDTGATREALAAAVQPLIQDYQYRTFPWVNVYSPADIVSGALDLYDPPALDPALVERRVKNLRDPLARRPLAAHTQYWGTQIVFDQLHAALVRRAATSP